jgi:hypothetical protein
MVLVLVVVVDSRMEIDQLSPITKLEDLDMDQTQRQILMVEASMD